MAIDDSYTKVLMHFDGEDESTTIVDEGGGTWVREAWTPPVVDTVIDQAKYKFGNASLRQGNWNEYLSLSGGLTVAMDPGSGDFTFDFQMLFSTLPTSAGQLDVEIYKSSANRMDLSLQYVGPTYYFKLHAHAGGVDLGGMTFGAGAPFSLSVDTWYHVEFCRTGNDYKLFLDGVLLDTVSKSAHTFALTGADFNIYVNETGAWLDEFRYSVGIARHTTGFTPPTEAYGPSNTLYETIEDSLNLSDELRYFAETIEETIDLIGELAKYYESGEDIINFAELLPACVYPLSANDGIALADICNKILGLSVADTVFIYDNALPGWAKTVLEGVNLADAPLPVLGIRVSDWLTLKDSQSNNWDGTEIVPPERLNLYDLPYGARVINRSIAESVQLADNITLQWIVGVLDYMRFSDLATVVGLFNHSAADTLRLTDEARRAFDKLIADVLALVDTAAVLISFMPSLAESLGLADASSCVSAIGKVVSDALVMTDQTTSGLSAYCLVQDAIALNVIIDIDGETYECYVLNTPKFFPSVYSGFDFNSYCMFEGKTYGANSTGIYELTGDTDAGETINTGVVLSQTTFGVPDRKKLRRAWLGISGTQPMLMLEVEDGTRRAYAIDTRGEVGSDRDISGKKWKLSVTSFDELDFIKILPVALAG
jgi:hypothetical protein